MTDDANTVAMAFPYFEESLAIFRELGDTSNVGNTYAYMGRIARPRAGASHSMARNPGAAECRATRPRLRRIVARDLDAGRGNGGLPGSAAAHERGPRRMGRRGSRDPPPHRTLPSASELASGSSRAPVLEPPGPCPAAPHPARHARDHAVGLEGRARGGPRRDSEGSRQPGARGRPGRSSRVGVLSRGRRRRAVGARSRGPSRAGRCGLVGDGRARRRSVVRLVARLPGGEPGVGG